MENRIRQQLKAENFENANIIERIVEDGVVQPSDNCFSKVSRFTIHFEKDGQKYEESILTIITHKSGFDTFAQQADEAVVEKQVYQAVLSLEESLLPNDSLIHSKFDILAGNEMLIIDELAALSGYSTLLENDQNLDLAHCQMALKLAAKFHALGVKIYEMKPHILDALRGTAFTVAMLQLEEDEYGAKCKERILKIIRRVNAAFAEAHPEVLQFIGDTLAEMAQNRLKMDENSFNVLMHANFTPDNILFRHNSNGQVTDAKLIAFERCRWGSPVVDFLTFAVTSISAENFEKNFSQLAQTYVNMLNDTLKLLECDRSSLKMEEFEKEVDEIMECIALLIYSINRPTLVTDAENTRLSLLCDSWMAHIIKKGSFLKYEDTAVAIFSFILKFEAENEIKISKYRIRDNPFKQCDNYCSGIVRVQVEYKKDGKECDVGVLLKIPSLAVVSFDELDSVGIFDRENYFYEKLLPELYRIGDCEPFSAHCYLVTDAKVLVLEDLTISEFRTGDTLGQLDLEHSLFALTKLAKFHAISYKYLQKLGNSRRHPSFKPCEYAPVVKLMFERMYHLLCEMLQPPIVSEAVRKTILHHKTEIVERNYCKREDATGSLKVLIHGDFRPGNILYKYGDDESRIENAKFIDWQFCEEGYPVEDIIFFLIMGVKFEIFQVHQDKLLNCYVDTLNDALASLKCGQNLYSREQLDTDMKKYNYFHVNTLIILLQVMSSCKSPTSLVNDSQHLSPLVTNWLNYLETKKII